MGKKGHIVPLNEIDSALQVQEKPLSEAMRYSPSIDQQSLLCDELKITPIASCDHASTTYSTTPSAFEVQTQHLVFIRR